MLDRGLWITWYDLPEDRRDAYLSWLHESYIPAILKRPGILWGAQFAEVGNADRIITRQTSDPSVPQGTRYILIFGAESAAVFGDPVPSALNASLPEASRKMLALRMGERVNIMTEIARIDCVDAQQNPPGMTLANCIQLGAFNLPWQDQEEMLAFYTQARMPKTREMPGCLRARTLASVAGWAKLAVIYEFPSLEARNSIYAMHEGAHPEVKAWSERIVPRMDHAPGSANVALRLWPAPNP